MKYKVQYVKNKLRGGYIGLNYGASKQLHIPFKHKHPKHTILIYHNIPHNVRQTTIAHEKAESYAIKCLKMNREKSHKLALRFETLGKPFPTYNIKQNLTRMGFLKRRIKRKKRFK